MKTNTNLQNCFASTQQVLAFVEIRNLDAREGVGKGRRRGSRTDDQCGIGQTSSRTIWFSRREDSFGPNPTSLHEAMAAVPLNPIRVSCGPLGRSCASRSEQQQRGGNPLRKPLCGQGSPFFALAVFCSGVVPKVDLWPRKVGRKVEHLTRRVSRGGTGAAGRSGAREGGENMVIFGSKSLVWVPENEKLKEKIAEVFSADTHQAPRSY